MRKPWPVLLMVRELGPGGTERQLTQMARSLDRSLFEPHVACFRPDGIRAEDLRAAGVPILGLPVRSFRSLSPLAGASKLGAYLRQRGIQLVHTFDYPMNTFGVPAARALGARVVISSQRSFRRLFPASARHLLRITDQMVDAVVVNCEAVRRYLIEEEKLPARRIHLCYNGLDTEAFRPLDGPRPAAPGTAELVVGTVAAVRPEKNLGILLEAFAEIRRGRRGLKLLIVGDGPSLPALRRQSGELGLHEDCRFEPATREVARWMRAIDVFVLPSSSEALSNSLMEAMACGCCVVASRVGGTPELVTHGHSGLLFPSGDVRELAAALRLVLDSEQLRQRLSREATRFLHDRFSLRAAARRLEEIYGGLLEALAPGWLEEDRASKDWQM